MSRPLWEIGEEVRELDAMAIAFEDHHLDGNIGDSFDPLKKAMERQMALLATQQGERVDWIIGVIRTCESDEAVALAEIDRLKAFIARTKGRREWYEREVKTTMEAYGEKELKSAKGRKIKIVGNGGVEPVEIVEGVEPDKVPAAFVKVSYQFDKNRIREALQSGENLVWASLGKRGTRLVIG